jgi:O-antigen/teichoic acid export membrane protein
MGLPLAALGWAFGRRIVVVLYGHDFAEAGPLFEWLSLNIGLIFCNVGLGNPFDAWGLQVPHFRISCAGAVVNVALNCFLIPRLGAWAAVGTTLIAEVVVGIACLAVRNRHIRQSWWSIVSRPFVVSLGAASIGRYLAHEFPGHWSVSLGLVTCGIVVGFWMLEKNSTVELLGSLLSRPAADLG